MSSVFLDSSKSVGSVVLSNNNLTVSLSGLNSNTRANVGKISGKWYWEITVITSGNNAICIGIHNTNSFSAYSSPNARYYYAINGNVFPENTLYGNTYITGDVIGVALDLDIGTFEFYKNGASQGISHTNIKSMGEVFPFLMFASSSSNAQLTANFGASTFRYSIPFEYHSYDGSQYGSLSKILLLSNSKTYSLLPKETKHETNMTSNTAPSPLVASSNWSYNANMLPYLAFNPALSTSSGNRWAGYKNGWLQLDLGSIQEYSYITMRTTVAQKDEWTKSFYISISTDGINFATIFDTTNIGFSYASEVKKINFKKNYKFRYIKFNFRESFSSSASYVTIDYITFGNFKNYIYELPKQSKNNYIKYGSTALNELQEIITNKNYILQDEASENEQGLWTTQLDRKPLSICFN